MTDTVDSIQTAIDATRTAFQQQRDLLEGVLEQDFVDPGQVADGLMSVADEYGREHALDLLRERPGDFGDRREGAGAGWVERADDLAGHLDRIMDTHDRLDQLTSAREKLVPRGGPASGQVINIQGREFLLDADDRELRAVDRPDERYPVEPEIGPPEPELSLTERVAQATGAAKAEPLPELERERTRTRSR